MFKLTIIAALVAASFSSATAQTVHVNELIYVGKKCPDCQELTKWQYSRKGFVEILKSPDFNAYVKIDWEAKTVTTEDGSSYKLEFATNERSQSQTYWYGGQKLTMYFNKNAEYIGHKIED